MKSSIVVSRRLWSVVAAAALVAVAGFQIASAKDDVLIKGSATAPPSVVTGGTLGTDVAYLTTTFTGTASHLGAFTAVVNSTNDGTILDRRDSGIFQPAYLLTFDVTITAANGDRIFAVGDGAISIEDPSRLRFDGTITGGTGRFEGATGNVSFLKPVFDPHDSSDNHPYRIVGSVSSAGSGGQ